MLRESAQTLALKVVPTAPDFKPIQDGIVKLLNNVKTADAASSARLALELGKLSNSACALLDALTGEVKTEAWLQQQRILLVSAALYLLSADFDGVLVKGGIKKADASSKDGNRPVVKAPPEADKSLKAATSAAPKAEGDDDMGFDVDSFFEDDSKANAPDAGTTAVGEVTNDDELGLADDGGSTVTLVEDKPAKKAAK